jgi:hypothetical protein
MKPWLKCAACAAAFLGIGLAALAAVENFDGSPPGALPAGWSCGATPGGKSDWKTAPCTNAPSAPNVLMQSGGAPFCWCVNTNRSFKNGWLETRFEPLSGFADGGAGLIWRFQNESNYYVVKANTLNDSIAVCKVVNGQCLEYESAPMRVTPRRWHTLRIEFDGPHFTAAYENQFALAWDDDTFTNAGFAGVWTKADTVAAFDNFHWEAGPDNVKN